MSGELEAAGALATAGMVAGAIEGGGGAKRGEGACLNCGAKLEGAFCSQCGQSAHPHRSLAHVFEEFLHGVIHFDTKAWRTAPMVIFRPGTLTRNYVYGQRARYISPLALFLFSIFLMFFAFSFVQAPTSLGGAPQEQRVEATEEILEAREELAQAQRELAAAQVAPPPTDATPAGLEVRLARQAVSLASAEVGRREADLARIDALIAYEEHQQRVEAGEALSEDAPPAPAAMAEGDVGWRPGETWQDTLRRSAQSDDFVVIGGMDELNERIRKKFENPDLAIYKIQQAAYKFSFLLVPISLPFVALLFLWKRGLTLYDHVVFTLYGLSFAATVFIATVWTAYSPWTSWITPYLTGLGLPVHTYFHLKGAYALGWWSALWRTFFMLTFAMIALVIFLIAIIVLGLTA